MIVVDVNVLVSAFHDGAPDHDRARAALEGLVNGPEAVGVSDAILIGTLRILTHPRVFERPASPDQALEALQTFVAHPAVHILPTTSRQWDVTARLVSSAQARGNLVPDASHAAHAMTHGATLVTHDRDFARFAGLSHRTPW